MVIINETIAQSITQKNGRCECGMHKKAAMETCHPVFVRASLYELKKIVNICQIFERVFVFVERCFLKKRLRYFHFPAIRPSDIMAINLQLGNLVKYRLEESVNLRSSLRHMLSIRLRARLS
jgi:hypothetical protein